MVDVQIKEPPMKLIKLEKNEMSDDLHTTNHQTKSMLTDVYDKPNHISASTIIAPGPTIQLSPPPPMPQQQPSSGHHSSLEATYCNICDIKFNYLHTYIAHKQSYCKASKSHDKTSSESVSPQSTVPVSRAVAETSVL